MAPGSDVNTLSDLDWRGEEKKKVRERKEDTTEDACGKNANITVLQA